jgi:HTH-type transcriptional regulator/antitoxin HigA
LATRTIAQTMPDSYFDLVKAFPLTHIRDDKHLDQALGVIDQLLASELDDGSREYLDVLTDLVEAYEEEHVIIPDASEGDVLRELMRSHRLSQGRLAKEVAIAQSTISAVLNGDRSLTKDQVGRLSKFFRVSPATFFPE